MKKTLIFGSLFIAFAMMSHGGNTLLAHAQTATATTAMPANATLQQELDVAKAQLVQLQMEAGQVPAGDSNLPGATSSAAPMSSIAPTITIMPTPNASMMLSATDVSEMNTVLTALTTMLTTLQTKIAQDPQVAVSNGAATVSSLRAIGNTLAAIVGDAAHENVAMATPQTIVPQTANAVPTSGNTPAAGSQGIAQANPTTAGTSGGAGASAGVGTAAITPTTGNNTPTVTPPPPPPTPVAVNTVPQTAQAAASFSLGKLNWPLIIVIILIVAAIAIWLWWDDSDDTKQTVVIKTTSSAPQRPLQPSNPVSMSTNNQGNPGQNQSSSRPVSGPQTPLSSAVSPQGNR